MTRLQVVQCSGGEECGGEANSKFFLVPTDRKFPLEEQLINRSLHLFNRLLKFRKIDCAAAPPLCRQFFADTLFAASSKQEKV